MHIGIDASRYRHEMPTGVEVYSREIIDGLLDIFQKTKTHAVTLYTPARISTIPEEFQRILPGGRLWTQRNLSREMKQNPPDVLFVPSHVLPIRHPKKSVITIHDVAFRRFPGSYSLAQLAYLHWSTKFAVKNAWKIIVPSEATREDLQNHYRCPSSKIVVIPHGFRPFVSQLSGREEQDILKRFHLHPDDPYFFFVGRLESKKNLARLVEAFMAFHATRPEWRLVIGGTRGVGFSPILKAVQKWNALPHILMPGYLTEEEKNVFMTHARAFVFPSLAEGFGFPILEAASHGVPVLASDIPALREFKALVDVYVNPTDTRSMADGLQKLADQNRTHHHKSLNLYSWPKSADLTWKTLTSL